MKEQGFTSFELLISLFIGVVFLLIVGRAVVAFSDCMSSGKSVTTCIFREGEEGRVYEP